MYYSLEVTCTTLVADLLVLRKGLASLRSLKVRVTSVETVIAFIERVNF